MKAGTQVGDAMVSPLIQELQKPEYWDLSHQQAADAIMAKKVIVRRPIPTENVKMHAVVRQYYANVEEGCNASDSTFRKLCRNVRAWIDDPAARFKIVDMDDPEVKQMLDGLVFYSAMDVSHRMELEAMANVEIRWVDHVGIGSICDGAVAAARGAM